MTEDQPRSAEADLALCDAATEGPWYMAMKPDYDFDDCVQTGKNSISYSGGGIIGEVYDYYGGVYTIDNPSGEQDIIAAPMNEKDARFIATAREALPDWIKRWQAENKARLEAEALTIAYREAIHECERLLPIGGGAMIDKILKSKGLIQ